MGQIIQGAFVPPQEWRRGAVPGAPAPEIALLAACPPETLKRLWRVIVTDLHPDRGGAPGKMAQANAAWDEIQRRRGMR